MTVKTKPMTRMVIDMFQTVDGVTIKRVGGSTLDTSRLISDGVITVFGGPPPKEGIDLRRFNIYRNVVFATGNQVEIEGNKEGAGK